jgi:AcrR family transcriptional regulator
MPVVDAHTEELIKETAMRIFFVEGRLHATTQVIAKEAGVNRGLIYYYFKGRDELFEVVFKEAIAWPQPVQGTFSFKRNTLSAKDRRICRVCNR